LDDLRSAALGWTTTIYSKNAGAEKFGRWPHLSVGHGRVGEFALAGGKLAPNILRKTTKAKVFAIVFFTAIL
jgi:hypothetical protein